MKSLENLKWQYATKNFYPAKKVATKNLDIVNLALGNSLFTCAELRIDACPMEGFKVEQNDEILNLSEQGLYATVIATIRYRSKQDYTQNRPKTRRPITELFKVA